MKFLFACVVFVAIVAVEARRQRCFPVDEPQCIKANTHYEDCGTACPRNCSNYDEESIICTKQCVKGCFCNKNYVLDAKKNCIPVSKCASVNPVCEAPNTHYEKCGTACPRNCSNYALDAIGCSKNCVKGCFCDKGYVVDANKNCIAISECPGVEPICKAANTHYEDCGTACPRNCSNYAVDVVACVKPCVQGCFCDEGYVLDADKNCIAISECPAVEPVCEDEYTHYEDCGTACPRNCINYAQESLICTKQCVRGCFCDKGYVLDADKKCVKECDCPAFPPNEEYSRCGANGCQNTCENPTLELLCKATCVEGFVCVDGYVRNEDKVCTKIEECSDGN